MDKRKIFFGIEKKFWVMIGVIFIAGLFVSTPALLTESQSSQDWAFFAVVVLIFCGLELLIGRAMTKSNTRLIDQFKVYELQQEEADQACRHQLNSFVIAWFKPVGEIVLEGDFPFLSASFNDQDGKRREIQMRDGEFFEKIG